MSIYEYRCKACGVTSEDLIGVGKSWNLHPYSPLIGPHPLRGVMAGLLVKLI